MTPLMAEIASAIATDGPMPLDRYMALCLSHPAHGYYATRDPFGRAGDFTTAPEISQMFGELIGLWAAEVWLQMGAPKRFALIELGPGRGTLMADMARAAKAAPGFLEAAQVTLVETSPTLREVQAKTLAGRDVRWAGTIEEALGEAGLPPSPLRGGVRDVAPLSDDAPPLPAIIVANEFFDALPIRQFVRAPSGWRERLVGLSPDGGLAFGLSPTAPDLVLPYSVEGSIREICPLGLDIAARIGAHLSAYGGAMLAIDYGYGSGFGDTLQAMRAHAFADPLKAPGEADLTAHVDFSALARAASACGAVPMRLLDQADLLERLGVFARAESLSRTAPQRRDEIFSAAKRLTDRNPRGMGALFKALAVCDPRMGPPPAFESVAAKSS
jgi:NADH dehydrogenase [ubiquinone] 1 alpha subcomplex assembly factor 7